MRGSILNRDPSLIPGSTLPPAPADSLESDHTQRVAGVPATGIVDADTARGDSDGVQHGPVAERIGARLQPSHDGGSIPPRLSTWTEADRLAFLRRVQHVDPRERRA